METVQRRIRWQTAFMQLLVFLTVFILSACHNSFDALKSTADSPSLSLQKTVAADSSSWAFFLQHLPEKNGDVVDYRGRSVSDQQKQFAIINYDVGIRDLQQCADALIRLRAEYLFRQQRYAEIKFHFTNGQLYSFLDYCNGRKPVPRGTDVVFAASTLQAVNHASLRRYLDIVYTYAGTISLAKELKPATGFAIGAVVISPGSPGHCFIITDQATKLDGTILYKLVEGYTPAQSIYVLRNTAEPELGCWHRLQGGKIETASYVFNRYSLKSFE